MKNRSLLTLLVWGLLAMFVFRTCTGDTTQPSEQIIGSHIENFDTAEFAEQIIVLENDLLYTEWSTQGAGCVKAQLKDFSEHNGVSENPDDWLTLLQSVKAQPPVAGEKARNQHHRRRDGLRLVEPAGQLGVELDAAEWQVEQANAQNVLFTLTTPTGVKITKSISLSSALGLDGEADDVQRMVSLQVSATPTEGIEKSVVGDLGFRLATGGGIIAEPDTFYQNPYAGAARLEFDKVDEVEVYHPSGSLPSNRANADKWNGQFAFVVEGSKYFLSVIRPLDRAFGGARAEALFDTVAFEEGLLQPFTESERESLGLVANADVALLAKLGRQPSADELASEIGLEASVVRRWRSVWSQAAAVQWDRSWTRTSASGAFNLHVGTSGAATESQNFEWYIGPKDPDILSRAKFRPLDAVITNIDFGGSFFYRMFFTGAVAPTILWIIKFFYSIVGNWGFAIILMTMLVRGLMFPINRSSQTKMAIYQAKVAKLKPQLAKINEKYAKDPTKKQQLTMELYREHKLSPPFGGCLPILLQFPIFIGLFAALRCSILLRHEPFMLWIQDLSRPDAFIDFGGPLTDLPLLSAVTGLNVLPLIMIVLWVWHQRSMPKPTDPQQAQMQKMMAFMPIMFGVMLYNYAAGLSLYMITSSSLGIFEQKVIKKRWPVPGANSNK